MRYVLDSFAILAHFREEPGAFQVRSLFARKNHEFWMTEVNLGEVYYQAFRHGGRAKALEAMDVTFDLPIRFVDADRILTLNAAQIKAMHPISYADCFAAALARQLNAKVVTGDPEFEQLERDGVVRVEWLIRKPKRRR